MNRLQERRMALGLTQPQVSARLKETEPRADVGMVSRYEKGVCLPTADQLKALEDVLGASRTELYDAEDLDLLGALPTAESRSEASETETAPPTAPTGRFRKCYRISREFAASLPDDLLQVCGYSSWQSWHDAMSDQLDKKSILEMSMGAILERVDYEMGKVMDNILDPNTKATAKRKISVTLELIPSADRRTITVQSTAKCSLTPTDPVTTSLYITNAPSTGELLVAEMVPQVPGQLALDGEEQDHPKILKFKRQA